MMLFEIRLERLRFYAYHGVFPQENCVGNEYEVDVALHFPCPQGGVGDCLEKTISYVDVYEIVEKEMHKSRKLLETVAESIAINLRKTIPSIISGEVSICKTAPPIKGMNGHATVKLIF